MRHPDFRCFSVRGEIKLCFIVVPRRGCDFLACSVRDCCGCTSSLTTSNSPGQGCGMQPSTSCSLETRLVRHTGYHENISNSGRRVVLNSLTLQGRWHVVRTSPCICGSVAGRFFSRSLGDGKFGQRPNRTLSELFKDEGARVRPPLISALALHSRWPSQKHSARTNDAPADSSRVMALATLPLEGALRFKDAYRARHRCSKAWQSFCRLDCLPLADMSLPCGGMYVHVQSENPPALEADLPRTFKPEKCGELLRGT